MWNCLRKSWVSWVENLSAPQTIFSAASHSCTFSSGGKARNDGSQPTAAMKVGIRGAVKENDVRTATATRVRTAGLHPLPGRACPLGFAAGSGSP